MILISILIILIILILWVILLDMMHPKLKSEYLDNLLKTHRFKTGDIILFHSYENKYSMFIGYYTHVGIVYVDPKDQKKVPFLFEAIGPPDENSCASQKKISQNGICISKLEDRLRRYKGLIFYKELNKKVPPEICVEFKNFINFATNHMFYDFNFHSMIIHKAIMRNICSINTNCGELVFLSLIKLGILPKTIYYKKISHHLLWISRLKNMNDGFFYKDPIYINDFPF